MRATRWRAALSSGPDRAEPRRPGPAEERASGPGLRFEPERIGLVGFRDGVWVGFLFYFFSYSN